MPGRIAIARTVTSRPDEDGAVTDALLTPERRSKKVGTLPDQARFVLAAVRRCLPEDVAATPGANARVGVSLGTFHGSMDVAERCLRTMSGGGFREVTPSWYATGLPNATAAIVASVHELAGPNLTMLGYQAGIEAIVMACRQILAGRATAMLAGGFDLPSPHFAARLAGAAEYDGTGTIHAGAGLVWLRPGDAGEPAGATVVGWSQGAIGTGETDRDVVARLIAAASAGPPDRHPAVHLVRPEGGGAVDHLAATAPIRLVDAIVGNGEPGLHALVVRGFGASAACLLVEKAV
ncbi:beta-ketoacyl synthase N-terminal-like domain-containing protein [Arenibaculum sp.]|uniref:beta-ketoacyl synthase N-terminal-like domain-containing protein n=1 Tax=Arenibaculum sp. TaxID=2865862 RepID=UPI002E119FC2|nr:beta-ketoacyl synthase N-terminal-like domain-containing protein [Arenibaculum sp.]